MFDSSVFTLVILLIEADGIAYSETFSTKRIFAVGILWAIVSCWIETDNSDLLVVATSFVSTLSNASVVGLGSGGGNGRARRFGTFCSFGSLSGTGRFGRGGRSGLGRGRSLGLRRNGDWVYDDSIFLIDSHPIDLHFGILPSLGLFDGQRVSILSKESPTDGNVEEEEEGLVKGLSQVGVRVGSSSRVKVSSQIDRKVRLSVHKKLDAVSFPDAREDVKVLGEIERVLDHS